MNENQLGEKIHEALASFGLSSVQEGVPIKVRDENGDIAEIKDVKFYPMNGGEIHICIENFDY